MVDVWRGTNLWGLTGLVLLLVFLFHRQIGFLLSATWAYFLLSALWVFENPNFTAPTFPLKSGQILNLEVQLDQTAGQAFAQLLLVPLVVLLLPENIFRHWTKLFLGVGVLNCGLLLFNGQGILQASSFDAGFVAALLPFAPLPAAAFYLVTIGLSARIVTALVILSAAFVSWVLAYFKSPRLTFLALTLVNTGLWFSRKWVSVHDFDSTGRTAAWGRFFQWWTANAPPVFGTGIGTFQWIGPAIDGMEHNLFLQMHSDWLQVLFEGGVLGFGLTLTAFVFLLYRSWPRPNIFAGLTGLGVFCLAYHPFHFFPTALFIACLIRECLRKTERPQYSQCLRR